MTTEPARKSKGLRYLTAVRPRAVDHLLKFFSESARHLDPKTRFLISVVTKVISHSPRGVRQYVRRALDEGASPDEILDAVLCAYPCAGLTRVVDAVDVILDMDLPGFDVESLTAESETDAPARSDDSGRSGESEAPEEREELGAASADGGWHEVADVRRIPAVGGLLVQVGGKEIALFRDGEGVAAVDDTCPHRGGSLSGGLVEFGAVVCPLHRWKFRLADGRCESRPRVSIATYETRLDGDKVLLKLS